MNTDNNVVLPSTRRVLARVITSSTRVDKMIKMPILSLYKVHNSCWNKNHAIKTKEFSIDHHGQIMLRHRSRQGSKTISKALNVHRSTVVSIIVIPPTVDPANSAIGLEGALVRGVISNPMATLTVHQKGSAKLEEPAGSINISEILQQPGLYDSVFGQKPFRLKGIWQALKGKSMRKKILWSDKGNTELFGLISMHYVWQKTGTAHQMANQINFD